MATAKAAKAGKSKAAGARRGGNWGLRLLGFLLMVLGLLMLPSALILLGMIPAAVAYITDRDPRKPAATSVAAMNICGVLPFEIRLWSGSNSVSHAFELLSDPLTWAIMLGAAGVGWLIYYSVPPFVGGVLAHRSEARVQELERRQIGLREAWGDEIARGS